MNVPAFKIGSGGAQLTLVEYIASFKKPIIMSTGMNSINQLNLVFQYLKI